jgi:hypothetical protein
VVNAAELFQDRYRLGTREPGFSDVRLHVGGADEFCRALGAQAVTIGSDVYFRDGAFDPRTRDGFRLIAHELAHVVQQQRGVAGAGVGPGLVLAPADSAEEREADAAADAIVNGRSFVFGQGPRQSAPCPGGRVAQRYMAWEHAMVGDLAPSLVGLAAGRDTDGAPGRTAPLETMCSLVEELSRDPAAIDTDRLRDRFPDVETLRLPGSSLVVTLGELNTLPDYLSHPGDIEQASADFLTPLLQSIRSWNIRELHVLMGRRRTAPKVPEAMFYPRLRGMADIYEAVQVDKVGARYGVEPWQRYSSVVSRNAAHFAPFSWFRWQKFHLTARDLIEQSGTVGGPQREELRTRARICAGYADHFLQDSFAAGHLINKTLVMQWYIEWLADRRVRYPDSGLMAAMTLAKQPRLHGAEYYDPRPAGPDGRLVPGGDGAVHVFDPQTAVEEPTLAARMAASGVVGANEDEQRAAYTSYLTMLGSNVAQLAAGVGHNHFNEQSLIVAAGADGDPFRLHGDRTLLAGGEGAYRAACAAQLSRRAIAELLDRGRTDIEVGTIFGAFPNHVQDNGALVPLRQWHDESLHALFDGLFGKRSTRVTRALFSVVARRLGVPSPDYPG